MADSPRSLDVLLLIVGVVDGLPLHGKQVGEAYELGLITAAEGRVLAQHARRGPRSQRAALTGARREESVDAELHAYREAKGWYEEKRSLIDARDDLTAEEREGLRRILLREYAERARKGAAAARRHVRRENSPKALIQAELAATEAARLRGAR